MKPSNTIIVSTKYIEEKERHIADLSKTIERLQGQLKEAVDFIEELSEACDLEGILYPNQEEKLEEIKKWR